MAGVGVLNFKGIGIGVVAAIAVGGLYLGVNKVNKIINNLNNPNTDKNRTSLSTDALREVYSDMTGNRKRDLALDEIEKYKNSIFNSPFISADKKQAQHFLTNPDIAPVISRLDGKEGLSQTDIDKIIGLAGKDGKLTGTELLAIPGLNKCPGFSG